MKTTPVINPDWLTKKQAAATLQIAVRTLDRYIRNGKIKATRLSKRAVRIPATSVERLLEGIPPRVI